MVQIQTHDGKWHVEETWPPEDMEWGDVPLDSVEGTGGTVNVNNQRSFSLPALEDDVHISGMPTLHLSVNTLACNGGQVFATMYADGLACGSCNDGCTHRDGVTKQTHGSSLRLHHAHGIQPDGRGFECGTVIEVVLTESGEDYLPSPCYGRSERDLRRLVHPQPTAIDRPADDDRWFLALPWWEQQPIPS